MSDLENCAGCGLILPKEDGPSHPYMLSSAACWRLYGEVMAREYADAALMEVHFLTVDAFAAQHPGSPDERRARQSVWIHLAGLKAVLRDGRPKAHRYALLRTLAERSDFPTPPEHAPFAMTSADMVKLSTVGKHIDGARRWAESTLSAYEAADPTLHDHLSALGG